LSYHRDAKPQQHQGNSEVGRLTHDTFPFRAKTCRKTKPIVQLLKKASKFEWADNCEQFFLQLKEFLASPPVIQKSNAKEPIIIYLVVSEDAVSSVLVQEVETEERLIYFVSRFLHGTKVWYEMIEKVVLALVMTVGVST